MGVKGLATFIKQRVPDVIRTLPLSSLSGKTLAVDGNVLTLRFHHSQESSSNVNRHIILWYRFVKRVRDIYNIKPIIVFDGAQRVPAKAKERERRYRARALLAGRAESEEARVDRLSGLQDVISSLQRQTIATSNRILSQAASLIDQAGQTGVLPPPVKNLDPLDTDLSLDHRLASLVISSNAKSDAALSRRQTQIAENEAKAFVQALVQRVDSVDVAATVEDVTDPLADIQTLLEESRHVADNYARRASTVSKQTYTDCIEMLRNMGVPVLLTSSTEPAEAESLCSSLVTAGFADFVASEDTDVLVFGKALLRGLSLTAREIDVVDGNQARTKLGFTCAQWIDFCLLCGTDFTERLKGLGPVNAHKLITKYGSIDAAIASSAVDKIIKADIPLDYMQSIAAARAIFTTPIPVHTYSRSDFEQNGEDPDLLTTLRSFGYLEDGALDIDGLDAAFGLASLGDAPQPSGRVTPYPGAAMSYESMTVRE